MASMSQRMSTDELIELLKSRRPPWDVQNIVYKCLKQQQETIKEQKGLIESLWSWAEEQEEKQEEDEFPKYTGAYIDFCNFKLHDEYKGEKEGYVYFNGPSGLGYYAIRYKD